MESVRMAYFNVILMMLYNYCRQPDVFANIVREWEAVLGERPTKLDLARAKSRRVQNTGKDSGALEEIEVNMF